MGKGIKKSVSMLIMVLTLATLVSAAPLQRLSEEYDSLTEGRTVLVQDTETGMAYSAVVLAIGRTVQGKCLDTDNGFKPDTSSEIFVYNPVNLGTRHLREFTFKSGLVKEFMCGEQGTINGISYENLAFAFWYHPTPQ